MPISDILLFLIVWPIVLGGVAAAKGKRRR
jgi:hypothetical protein